MEELTLDKRIRLSAMMFLQYMYFAVFFVPLAAYVSNIGVKGILYGTILSSMPLGCLMSPIVCMIADRHFASQKVLAILNLVGNGPKSTEIQHPRIGRPPGNDNFRPVLARECCHFVEIDAVIIAAYPIRHGLEPAPRHVHRRSMGEVASGRQR